MRRLGDNAATDSVSALLFVQRLLMLRQNMPYLRICLTWVIANGQNGMETLGREEEVVEKERDGTIAV